MIRCDSEIPQLRRDELDGEECDANGQEKKMATLGEYSREYSRNVLVDSSRLE